MKLQPLPLDETQGCACADCGNDNPLQLVAVCPDCGTILCENCFDVHICDDESD